MRPKPLPILCVRCDQLPMAAAREGAQTDRCHACRRAVWLSPIMQRMRDAGTAGDLICLDCAEALSKGQPNGDAA